MGRRNLCQRNFTFFRNIFWIINLFGNTKHNNNMISESSSPRWSLASSLKVGCPTPHDMRLSVEEDNRKIAKKIKMKNSTFSIIAKGTFLLGVLASILVLFLALFRHKLARDLHGGAGEDESSVSWRSVSCGGESY